MPSPIPVIAAVPNYNMAESLKVLLPQLLKQGYDAVYVLDDASTDNSREVAKSFGPKVELVAGKTNVGAGANRNRILSVLKEEAIIHFIDADMWLETDNVPQLARQIMSGPNIGFIGGLVKENNRQHKHNYGPKPSIKKYPATKLYHYIDRLSYKDRERAARLRKRFKRTLQDRPNIFATPAPNQAFWASEANMLFNSETFTTMKGYDESLREHEIVDLAFRLHSHGFQSSFDPRLAATHLAVNVRPGNRRRTRRRAALQVMRKRGLRHYVRSK